MVRRKPQKPQKDKQSPSTSSPAKRRSSGKASAVREKSHSSTIRRCKPGVRALREIKYLQRTANLLMHKRPFVRVVREIMQSLHTNVDRIQSAALLALQEAAEMYLVNLFEDSMVCAIHAKRVTVFHTDMRLVKRLRGVNDPGNA